MATNKNNKTVVMNVKYNDNNAVSKVNQLNKELIATQKTLISINKEFANLSKKDLMAVHKSIIANSKAMDTFINKITEAANKMDNLNKKNNSVSKSKKGKSTVTTSSSNSTNPLDMLDAMGLNTSYLQKGGGGLAAIAFAGYAVNEAKKLMEYEKEVKRFANSLNITNKEVIANSAVNVKSLVDTYAELDSNQVLRSATNLSKLMGISLEESLSKLEKGISTTSNDRNEYLAWIEEYTSVLKDEGYNADDVLNIQQVAENFGTYKDKLLDAVKEFKIRMTDLTDGQRTSLNDAFGEEFTTKLVKDINTGAINAKEGLKLVIKELDNTKVTAQQKQAVISDIFAAVGEDLGSEFMPVMKAITQESGQLDKAFDNLSSGQKANLEATKAMNEQWAWFKENILPSSNTIEHITAAFKRMLPIITAVGVAIGIAMTGFIAVASVVGGLLLIAKGFEKIAESTESAIAAKKAFDAAQSTTVLNKAINERSTDLQRVKDALATIKSNDKNANIDEANKILTEYAKKFGTTLDDIMEKFGATSLESFKNNEAAMQELSNAFVSLDEKVLNTADAMSSLPSPVRALIGSTISYNDAIGTLEAEMAKNNKQIDYYDKLMKMQLEKQGRVNSITYEESEKFKSANAELQKSIDQLKNSESAISGAKLYQGEVIQKKIDTATSDEDKKKKKELRYTSDIPFLKGQLDDANKDLIDKAKRFGESSIEYRESLVIATNANEILVDAMNKENNKGKSNDVIVKSDELKRLNKEKEALKRDMLLTTDKMDLVNNPEMRSRSQFTLINPSETQKNKFKGFINDKGQLDLNKLFGTKGTEMDYESLSSSLTADLLAIQEKINKKQEEITALNESLKSQSQDNFHAVEEQKKQQEKLIEDARKEAVIRDMNLSSMMIEIERNKQSTEADTELKDGLIIYEKFMNEAKQKIDDAQNEAYKKTIKQVEDVLGVDNLVTSGYTDANKTGSLSGTAFLEGIDYSKMNADNQQRVKQMVDNMLKERNDIADRFYDEVNQNEQVKTFINSILNRVKSENQPYIDTVTGVIEEMQDNISLITFAFEEEMKQLNEITKKPFNSLTNEEKATLNQFKERMLILRKELRDNQLHLLELELGEGLKRLASKGLDKNTVEFKNLQQQYSNKKNEIEQSYIKDVNSTKEGMSNRNNRPTRQMDEWQNELNSYMDGITPIVDNSMNLINSLFDYYTNLLNNQLETINKSIQTTETQLQDSISNMDRMSADLEGKESGRRDALLRGIEEERNRQEELTKYKLKLQEDAAKKEKEIAKQKQRQSLLQAIISTALGVTTALGSSVPPLNFINAGLVGAAGAAQIATIGMQKFAKGGYTGDGLGNLIDETGYRVAGVVHEGEYVVKKSMVNANPSLIDNIEKSRISGKDVVDVGNNNVYMKELISLRNDFNKLASKPIYTNAVENNRVSDNYKRKTMSL